MDLEVTVRRVERPERPAELLGPDGFFWSRAGNGFVTWGEARRIEVGTGAGSRAAAARRASAFLAGLDATTHDGTSPLAFGSFTFDPEVPGSVFVVPKSVLRFERNGGAWLTTIGAEEEPPARREEPAGDRVRYAGSTIPDHGWLDAVARAVAAIRRDEYRKVVLARDLHVWSKAPFHAPRLLTRLAERFPDCYTFAAAGLIGASPELLVRRSARSVASLVLAGSAARSSGVADEELGRGLLESGKDKEEHLLAVESVLEPLGLLCEELDVRSAELLRLANVQHLATAITGRLRAGRADSALELAGRLHPTAAVCGTPMRDALEAIRALEGMDRGRYAGPVGWVDATGDGEWAIALRCAELGGARGRLFAGAGIVAGSEPETELEETRLKLAAMISVLD